MKLEAEERERFLAEPHVAALSVVDRPDRAPLTVPIWYQYKPGGEAWVLTQAGSKKARRIEAAGRFTLMVDRLAPTVRYVTAEGPVTRTQPMTEEKIWEIAQRYLPEDSAAAYVKMSLAEHGEQVVIHMRPEHWLSSDLGGF
ncbi:pyridoxamine 5'-phosphate oxidase family protein [Phytoactinopolyspora alkaliphila]|uniref:Pyridoxamine 5'-phosphate oxidase family protein n=1 Tax=Phytoactinopolyspora alkaliphila TaxID=1783498 RepID=A0A6N9YNA1_9ACTN|nr:pyridoxamine 5'-phosphate oxidase family protein [Phytoactinopolyspora alkaliphila]NED96400.1 pyridoxamine 5'-phosphate oxidase family protein [Phytoactinopolyspora alkaliphila]